MTRKALVQSSHAEPEKNWVPASLDQLFEAERARRQTAKPSPVLLSVPSKMVEDYQKALKLAGQPDTDHDGRDIEGRVIHGQIGVTIEFSYPPDGKLSFNRRTVVINTQPKINEWNVRLPR